MGANAVHKLALAALGLMLAAGVLAGCRHSEPLHNSDVIRLDPGTVPAAPADAAAPDASSPDEGQPVPPDLPAEGARSASGEAAAPSADDLRKALDLTQDMRASFDHGPKPAEFQKYIVLHDTQGRSGGAGVIESWDSDGVGIAAHFVVDKDGAIWQCVPLDRIAHHAGFGDTGHDERYGVEDESRDDKVGTTPIGDWASDYGMNSYSIGIEIVHVGGEEDYPEAQLDALDALIAYLDAYFGGESEIIDHKAWRTGNPDTSPEFAGFLANYQDHRTHLPA